MKNHATHRIEPLEARIAPAFAATIDLGSLAASAGFKINGAGAGDFTGNTVREAGDINGDGFDDAIVTAYQAAANGFFSGATYVIFGKAASFGASFDLANLTGANGFKIKGVAAYDDSGYTASAAGDINGDGIDDLAIGAPSALPNGDLSGAAYVVFGRNTATQGNFAATLELSALNGTNGFKLNGAATGDRFGVNMEGLGDLNGDGFDDLLIGADKANGTGAAYVVFGRAASDHFPAVLEVSSFDGARGFKINGAAFGDRFGYGVASAGDVNGDGLADLIVGSGGAAIHGDQSGAAYVIFGKNTATHGAFPAALELSSLNGTNGFRLTGASAGDLAGFSVSGAADVNGDGFDDLIVGAPGLGASYVVFGKASAFAASVELSALDGVTGFRFNGNGSGDFFGRPVSGAGDVNGDGYDDLIVGAVRTEPLGRAHAGASYVLFGKPSFAATLATSALDGTDGFKAIGAATYDYSGSWVSGAGDLNGDGFDDVIIGAPAAVNGSLPGAAYVIFGSKTPPLITIDDVTVSETAAGPIAASFTVHLATASTSTVTVQYVTASGSATAPGDYTALPLSTLTFAPGVTSKTITVAVNDDALDEASETFFVNLSNPTNARLGETQGIGTILDNDPPPAVSIGDVSVSEGDSGTVDAHFPVSLSAISGRDVTVHFTTADLEAKAGSDYTAVALGTVTIPAGALNGTASVAVNGDTTIEFNEHFTVTLSDPTNATIATAAGTATILNDDDGFLTFSATKATFADADGDMVTVRTTKGAFTKSDFALVAAGDGTGGGQLQLLDLHGQTAFKGTNLTISAAKVKGGSGDGLVNVGAIDATGIDLGTVSVSGDLGQIDAGDPDLTTAGVKTLSVGSLGVHPENEPAGTLDPLHSSITGPLGSFVAKHNVAGFLDVTGGTKSGLGTVTIGGDLDGSAGGAQAGLIESGTGTGIGAVTVKGGILGGADSTGLVSGGKLGKVTVLHDIAGTPAKRVTISALGKLGATTAADAVGIAGLSVIGNVANARILAGFDTTTGAVDDPGAGIGPESIGKTMTNAVIRATGAVGAVTISGDLDGSAGGTRAGLIEGDTGVGAVTVKGNLIGGADFTGVISGGKLGKVTVLKDIIGTAAKPVTISALGKLGAKTAADAVAIAGLAVTGKVSNTRVLAGYNLSLAALNPDAGIGAVIVGKDWTASSLVAGVKDTSVAGNLASAPDGFGRHDTLIGGDTTATIFATIASITIKGAAIGSVAPATDFFGFTAQKIGKVSVHGLAVARTGTDTPLDSVNNDFHLVTL